ncbi:hypothetical protein [Aminipila sp.]|uniref:hypothetical protein n=1 Tax=Aminipila sp. TaxID=2060095 RepID=UPI0028999922|nr:hypothetical protein [Aminipila sp.]
MKQIIVLAAFIALGIFIAGIVMGFQEDVDAMGKKSSQAITKITNSMTVSSSYTGKSL